MKFVRMISLVLLGALASPGAGFAREQVRYELHGLKFVSSQRYSVLSRDGTRDYLRFEGTDGAHYLIYENLPGTPAVPAVRELLPFMGKAGVSCSLTLDCRSPAFCFGACKNRYYEVSNTPDDLILAGRNQCTISSHHCESAATAPATAAKGGSP